MENSKIDINLNANWDGLDLEIHFLTPVSVDTQKEIKEQVSAWAQKGITEGYGEGHIHDEGRSFWGKDGEWYRVWLDMGSADETAFNKLEKILLPYSVDMIRVGYEFPENRYEQDEEFKQVFRELQDLKKDNK